MTTEEGLPPGWMVRTLGDVATVTRGVTYRKGQAVDAPADGFVPLLRSGNIRDRLIIDERLMYVPEELVRDDQFLQLGDVVVSTSNSRERVGKSAGLFQPWKGTFGAFCSVVRPLPEVVEPGYVALFLQSPAYRDAIARRSAATNNIANIRAGHLLGMQISLPSRDEQAAVVEAVGRLRQQTDTGRSGLSRALDGLINFRASCLASAFEGAWSDSADFEIVSLDELASVQSGIAKGRTPEGATVELPYIRTANVQAGFLDLSVIKTLGVTEPQRQKHRLQHGDVLVLEGGDADKVGRGWLWEGQLDECLHQNHVFAVRTGERLIPRFLAYFLNAPQARAYFLSCAKQTTNLASINKRQLKALPVPVPALEQQRDIIELLDRQLDATRRQQRAFESQLTDASKLDAAVLHQGLNGGLGRTTTPRMLL